MPHKEPMQPIRTGDGEEDEVSPGHLCTVVCTNMLSALGFEPTEIIASMVQGGLMGLIAQWALDHGGDKRAIMLAFDKFVAEDLRPWFSSVLDELDGQLAAPLATAEVH